MPWDLIIFYLLAAVCILAAGGVVAARNPVHAAIFLVICFFNVAGVFVMLGAEFLAVIQVIVYTGAILVLVLFVLMLVDPEKLPEFHTGQPIQRYVGFLLGLILLLEVGIAIIDRAVAGVSGTATPENVQAAGGNVQSLGMSLYSQYLLPFEIISLVLTVGVIGAIVLALPERLGKRTYRRDTISPGHPRGTDLSLPRGAFGESLIGPMPPRETSVTAGRRLIMVKDPDEQPTLNRNGRS
jgi:NADH-quinone oxidoreductase subunit J